MAKVKIQGHASGTGVITVTAPNTSTDRTITLPDSTGTLLTADGDGSSLTGVGVAGITSAADATAITIDSSENVGIGTSSPTLPLDIVSNSGADALKIRARTGDDYGTMTFYNNAGTTKWADIQAKSTKDLIIYTNGGSERVRVLAGGGITFNGDTAAANALDDYEEGTWTPALVDGTSITINKATYTKIGRLVHFYFYIDISGGIPNNSTDFRINGFPFTPASSNYYPPVTIAYSHNTTTAFMYPLLQQSYLYAHRGDGNLNAVTNANIAGMAAIIIGGTYQTA